jgi:hypothetical protein
MAARPTDADSRARAHRAAEVRQASMARVVASPAAEKSHGRAICGSVRSVAAVSGGHSQAGTMSLRTLGLVERRVTTDGSDRSDAVPRRDEGQARAAAGGRAGTGVGRRTPGAGRAAARPFASARIAARSSAASWWP